MTSLSSYRKPNLSLEHRHFSFPRDEKLLRPLFQEQRRKKMDTESFFNVEDLPALAAEKVACFLDGRDLINLGYTCKYWYEIASKNYVWKKLVQKRFGENAIEGFENTEGEKDEYKKLYFKLAVSRKSVTTFNITHLGDTYLERIADSESEYGEVIRLNTVCWLSIIGKFQGVLPGTYKLLWRMKLEDAYVNGDDIEFRAKPKEGYGTALTSKWGDERLLELERRFGSNWFKADMGEFTVDMMCDVEVEIFGRIPYWCGGITWDTVEMKPVAGVKAKPEVPTNNQKEKTSCLLS